MKVEWDCTVRKVYRDPVDMWCVKVARDADGKEVTYIRFGVKPKVKPGRKLRAGDEI